MPSQTEQLKDVKCEKCNRVIGQRKGDWLYRNGMWSQHRRSFTFLCPFLECGAAQDFKVNRENNHIKVKDFQAVPV